jgi:hypothetical protein
MGVLEENQTIFKQKRSTKLTTGGVTKYVKHKSFYFSASMYFSPPIAFFILYFLHNFRWQYKQKSGHSKKKV